jgi:hypothetical protein
LTLEELRKYKSQLASEIARIKEEIDNQEMVQEHIKHMKEREDKARIGCILSLLKI